MPKKINVETIYERVLDNLPVGVRQNRFFLKEDDNWKGILDTDLAIRIRMLFEADEQKIISSGAVKEVIERLLQDPRIQLHFTEETEERYLKLVDGVFDVERGEINKNFVGDFGYHLDFTYLTPELRNMQNFGRYIESVFPTETSNKKKLMLEILGYVLSDYTKAKAGFFLVGESNSGKSTILELVKRILPENSVTSIPLYRLDNRFNLARLANARVNICTELSEKSFSAVDIFKMLTSNEIVTAEHKGCRPFEFRMRCKSLNAGNVIPDINGNEEVNAIINRMILLLFPVSIPKGQQDIDLVNKLWAERNSIFSSALDELVLLRKRQFQFTEPEDSKKLRQQLQGQGRILENFISDRCVIEENGRVHLSELFDVFTEFCNENLLEAKLSKSQFSQRLSRIPSVQHGKFRINGSRPLSGVKGIRLKTDKEYLSQDSDLYSTRSKGEDILLDNRSTRQEVNKNGTKENNSKSK